jgi:hypothetical protein
MTSILKDNSLFMDSEKCTRLGWFTVGIADKEPPKGCTWTDKRGTVADVVYRQKYFCNNDDVKRLAILLDSIKFGFALDVDGSKAMQIFQRKIIPRYSQGLQDKINMTTHTKTANSGNHWLFEIKRKDFPKGISQRQYWTDKQEKHGEIKLIGTNQYVIERGIGYHPIRGIESLVSLSQQEANEFLNILDEFDKETISIRNVSSRLLKYYVPTNRQNLVLRVAGYLHKHHVPEYLCCNLVEYLIEITDDDEPVKRFQAVRDTYVKDADTDKVSGHMKLLEVVDGDESVIILINQEIGNVGYHFNGNCHTDKKASSKEGNDHDDSDKGVKLSAEVIKLLEPNIDLLFKNQFDSAFAAIQINGHREIVPLHKSKRLDLWVRKTFYDETENTLGSEVLKEVVETLEAKALFDGQMKALELRISKDPHDELTYWYDLCNEKWEAIKITEQGWSIVKSDEVPIIFRRYSGHQAQVYPSEVYPSDILDHFIGLINLKDSKNTKLLVKCYIIAVLIPGIAKAMLMVHGPKGAAKTAFEDLLKVLLDPSILTSLTLPRTSEALVQQLMHNFLIYYDNVSTLPEWLSNDLCRAVTGTASSKRELYTDDDDVIYQYMKPIGFNGINLAATRSDALDRGLIIETERIKDEKRRSWKDDILPEFERLKPQLLGFIFDIIVKVLQLKANGGPKLKSMERMADFEITCEMISRCLGYEAGSFVEAYKENKKLATSHVLESSPVAKAIISLMESRDTWSGTHTNLLSDLEDVALKLKINIQRDSSWPKGANALSRKLPYIKDNLEEVGIFMHTTEDTKTKLKTIILCKISPEPSESSDKSKLSTDYVESSYDIAESTSKISSEISPDQSAKKRAQIQDSDDSGGSDGILQHSKAPSDYSCEYCSKRFDSEDRRV